MQTESYILPISGAMQEIPNTPDKFGLDCIVDGSIPAGTLDNNENVRRYVLDFIKKNNGLHVNVVFCKLA